MDKKTLIGGTVIATIIAVVTWSSPWAVGAFVLAVISAAKY